METFAMRASNRTDQSLYVAANLSGHHKVGITNNVDNRFRVMAAQDGAVATLCYLRGPSDGAGWIEMLAHHDLMEFHLEGEWFDVSEERAISAVETAFARFEAGFFPASRPALRSAISPAFRELGFLDRLARISRVRRVLRPGEGYDAFVRAAIDRLLEDREGDIKNP